MAKRVTMDHGCIGGCKGIKVKYLCTCTGTGQRQVDLGRGGHLPMGLVVTCEDLAKHFLMVKSKYRKVKGRNNKAISSQNISITNC